MIKKAASAVVSGLLGLGLLLNMTAAAQQAPAEPAQTCDTAMALCHEAVALELPGALDSLKESEPQVPDWLAALRAPAQSSAGGSRPISGTVTYSVETRGAISSSLAEFKQQANATLNDSRGWSQLGVRFQEVPSGGNFTLVLSEASQVPSFSPGGCSATYSCRVGRFVVINQDRWVGATPSWNAAGGSLRDYRHMVVNHETGHWLGHGHTSCSGAGQPAPLMQQQSISLQGCSFNAWPLANELRSPTLGR